MSKQENPVDHVLDRMVEASLGESAHFRSHAEALHVPLNTIRTWKRRQKVPLYELEKISERYGVPIDWLLHGDQAAAAPLAVSEKPATYGIAADERKLLDNYAKCPPEVRETLQLVASIASRPSAVVAAPAKKRQPVHAGAVERVQAGSHGVGRSKAGRIKTDSQ